MRGQTEEMTVGRQFPYHCPSVVVSLKQVELFVWQRGRLDGREDGFYLTESRVYTRNVAQTEYRSCKKGEREPRKGILRAGVWESEMSGGGSPCRQVVGDNRLTRLLRCLLALMEACS